MIEIVIKHFSKRIAGFIIGKVKEISSVFRGCKCSKSGAACQAEGVWRVQRHCVSRRNGNFAGCGKTAFTFSRKSCSAGRKKAYFAFVAAVIRNYGNIFVIRIEAAAFRYTSFGQECNIKSLCFVSDSAVAAALSKLNGACRNSFFENNIKASGFGCAVIPCAENVSSIGIKLVSYFEIGVFTAVIIIV